MPDTDLNNQVQETLKGSFDLRVNIGPDPYVEHRVDGLQACLYAYETEMAGFVIHSSYHPTSAMADILNRVYPNLTVVGSVTMSSEIGGLNPSAVQVAADMGGKVVWLPANTETHLTDNIGKLPSNVHDILDIILGHDMVLALGGLSYTKTLTLFKEAKNKGIKRMLVSDSETKMSVKELEEIVSLGAFTELSFASYMSSTMKNTPAKMLETVKTLGADKCIITSNFGQWFNPTPAEGMRMAIASLIQTGLSHNEVSKMVKTNPLELVSLDS